MKGFFSKEDTKFKNKPDGRIYSCVSCGLYKNCNNPKLEPYGNFKKGILNIGEVPSFIDDQKGKPWQDKTGRLLKKAYKKFGIDLFEDCLNINAVNCSVNRMPSDYEITCCRNKVLKLIEEYQPKVIILLGTAAVKSFLGHRWKKNLDGIYKWRGFTAPDRDYKAWVCPIFHPAMVEQQSDKPEATTIWYQDIERALGKLDDPFPTSEDDTKNIEYIYDEVELAKILKLLSRGKKTDLAFFDYETTGLKPHADGHKIVCCAIADSPKHAYSFMMPKEQRTNKLFNDFLISNKVKKGAANMKFEHAWSMVKQGVEPVGWVWDTMQAAHILDNRKGVTGLKFQAYINLGVIDYASHIEPYLRGTDEKNANSKNTIFDFIKAYGEKELLLYCGLDALYEYQIGLIQMKQLGFNPNFLNKI